MLFFASVVGRRCIEVGDNYDLYEMQPPIERKHNVEVTNVHTILYHKWLAHPPNKDDWQI